MVWRGDGLSQHYVALCYYARWGKAVLKSILAGHPAFPTFNMHMGFGSDLFTTLQYYVIGDPFSLPAVFVPQKYMLVFHDAMIPVRMYLAGICFERYCAEMGHRNTAGSLCGALMYVFSSFVLFGMRHPYFLNAMIWFPLLLIGAEHIFRGRKGRLFTAAVFLSCISNFYFFYMLVVMTVLYVVWRALRICLFCPQALKRIFVFAGKFLWRALLGTALGAFFLLPILLRFLQDPRVSGDAVYGLLYPAAYYKGMLESFVGFGTETVLENWTCLGMGGMGLMGVLMLFIGTGTNRSRNRNKEPDGKLSLDGSGSGSDNKTGSETGSGGDNKTGNGSGSGKERENETGNEGVSREEKGRRRMGHPDLKIAFVCMVLMTLVPAAGAALNGFTYPVNRWVWALCMLTAYIAAVMLPSLQKVSAGRMALILFSMAAYTGGCVALGARKSTILEMVFAVAAAAAAWTAGRIGQDRRSGQDPAAGKPGAADDFDLSGISGSVSGEKEGGTDDGPVPAHRGRRALSLVCGALLTGTVILTSALHGYICFAKGVRYSGLEEYRTDQYIAAMMESDAAGMRSLLGNDTFYRYSGRYISNNFALLNDVSDTQYYWSLSDSRIEQFFTETGQSNGMVHMYDNLDNRTMLDEIAGVSYQRSTDNQLMPFGYEEMQGLYFDNRELFEEKEGDPLPDFHFSVYKNQYALPLGFTSGRYLTREVFNGLSIPQRQEALMQGILLEDEGVQCVTGKDTGAAGSESTEDSGKTAEAASPEDPGKTAEAASTGDPGKTAEAASTGDSGKTDVSGIREAELSFTEEEIPFSLRAREGIEITQDGDGSVRLVVSDPEVSLHLDPKDEDALSKGEISLLLTGMTYTAPEIVSEEDKVYSATDPVIVRVAVSRGKETVSGKEVQYTLPDNPWKTGRSDFLSCCGYTDEPLSDLRLQFFRRGVYTFREMKIIRQPMDEYPARAQSFAEYVLEDLDLHELPGSGATDRINGRLTLPERRILCLQIPRCDGLRAYVDGKEVTLLQADTMFCALVVEAGTHEIELRYRTPGLAAGAGICAAALLFCILEAGAGLVRKKSDSRE